MAKNIIQDMNNLTLKMYKYMIDNEVNKNDKY